MSRAEDAAKATIAAFREAEVSGATRRWSDHSICVAHMCHCKEPGVAPSPKRLAIHARIERCHAEGPQ